jgi:hypothetical protein
MPPLRPHTSGGRRCPHCGRPLPEPLTRCRRRSCPGYAPLWAGDQRRKLFVNLGHYAEVQPVDRKPSVVLLTVTAPGADALPWDEHHCRGLGEHRHSGTLGCRVRSSPARDWNAAAAGRWRDLHRAAYVRCRREGLRPHLLTRVWEMQHRGVLHVHPVLAFTTPGDRRAARRYVAHLAELAPSFGFGFVDRKLQPMHARAAAAYLSAYFVTGRREKAQLHQSVMHPAMPRSIVHVSTRLTRATGCTMRRLRLHRFVHVRWGKSPLCVGDTWHVLDDYAVSDRGVIRAPP